MALHAVWPNSQSSSVFVKRVSTTKLKNLKKECGNKNCSPLDLAGLPVTLCRKKQKKNVEEKRSDIVLHAIWRGFQFLPPVCALSFSLSLARALCKIVCVYLYALYILQRDRCVCVCVVCVRMHVCVCVQHQPDQRTQSPMIYYRYTHTHTRTHTHTSPARSKNSISSSH